MVKYYAGIGSRKTPREMLDYMSYISKILSQSDWILRSGGAEGADTAFEKDAKLKEIFYACDATEEAIEMASKYHPAWWACSDYAKQLHGRNAMIILGEDLKTPVDFIICWTKGGKEKGGTALGMKIARANNIPVYNLATMDISAKYWNVIIAGILNERDERISND